MLKALPAAIAVVFSQAGNTADITAGAGLPQNGTVVSGSVAGSATSDQLTINQSTARAVLDWRSFNIDAGKTVQFVQPSAASAVLNRVSGDANASQILGSLSANGTVMLMNPNGVMFGPSAVVNVGSLIATTGVIDENRFVQTGQASITGAAGRITHQGNITATAGSAGLVALVAPSVVNQGRITASGGTIALAGSNAATISLNNGLYEFVIPAGAIGTQVSNAAGASLQAAKLQLSVGDAANLVSGVINLEGVQQATSAIVVNGDTVVLKSVLDAPVVSGNSNKVQVHGGARIQDAVDISKTGVPGSGAVVTVQAGTYAEQVRLNKANMTLTGMPDARLQITQGQTGLDISANGVTVEGMHITGPYSQNYKTVDWTALPNATGITVRSGVSGANLRNNTITDVRSGIQVMPNATVVITGNTIDNTKGSIIVRSDRATMSGNRTGAIGNEWDIVFLDGVTDGAYFVSPNISEANYGRDMMALSAANGDMHVLDRRYGSNGLLRSTPQFGNRSHVTVSTGSSYTAADDFALGNGLGNGRQPLGSVQAGINAVVAGGVVNVTAGTYVQPSTLNISKSLTLAGAGEGATVIDSRGVNGYGLNVTADQVTLKSFTLYGPSANVSSSYGIKVQPAGNGAAARVRDFSISDVTIRGSGRAELDLHGVDGAVIDRVTADGAPVGGAGMTAGAGIQITDSANIIVRNAITRNNDWGGLALYQSNRYYNQQVSNITVDASNSFSERNPVYLQDESNSRDFGALNIAGFGFAVRNAGQSQYTWLQASQQSAFDFAAADAGSTASNYVQTWDGARATQDFHVGIGNLGTGGTRALSIGTAINNADRGANIHVEAGNYAENVILNSPYNLYFNNATVEGLKFTASANGAGIGGTVTAGAGGIDFQKSVTLLSDTTLATQGADIAVRGDIQSAGSSSYGLRLIAGTGSNRGNVYLNTAGSEGRPLGNLQIVANNFHLESTFWVQGYAIDALGNVALSSHTLRAQDTNASNTVTAGGDVTGSTISLGQVAVVSGGDIDARITATDVVAQAQGDMNVVVMASKSVSLTADKVVANITAPVAAVNATTEANIFGSSPEMVIDAPKGSVTGNFGQVTNTGSGLVNVNGKPQGNPTLSSNADNSRVLPAMNVMGAYAAESGGQKPQGPQPAPAAGVLKTDPSSLTLALSTPEAVGDAIDSGKSVELDLSPRKDERRNKR